MADDDGKTTTDAGKELTAEDAKRLQAALAKEREERRADQAKLREAQGKADKLDELENASRSEVEKAAQRLADAERRAAESDLRAARLEAAATHGIPLADAKRLVGTTPEELLADAEEWAKGRTPADDGKGAGADDGKGDQGAGRQPARQTTATATTGDADAAGGGPEVDMNERIRLAARR